MPTTVEKVESANFSGGKSVPLTIEPIELGNKKDIETFLHLPWKIYAPNGKKDPNWVPPFLDDQRSLLSLKKNPYFVHAKVKLFGAYNERREIIGRISASVDDNFNNFWNDKIGFFGWFECINDETTAKALFLEAEKFLKGGRHEGRSGAFQFYF